MTTGWEHFSHEADMGLRGYGVTPKEAFEQTGLALTATVTELDSVSPDERVDVECEAPDLELLLVDWINALVYEMATRNMLFSRFAVKLDGNRLSGSAWGEPVQRQKHMPAVEAKGATYTALKVCEQENGGWMAQCVIDV
ncbi:archease [Microbulbifer rhizosphaerae]|uniref:tRNA nucleotidyltransferase (CCA-adding enzyme) n=1 Tax=Microbulbifer rhizosphaerae TaxID=1562603 RepID=A0A7W4Z819_9GAMM|nr:archease [Microbulbifer rhizosphaerae]MBB3060117.1 tRNA nucleotidyltransferase (CCA-adding enzyme) [Microbulbifer rhizosphaerae]